MISWESFHSVKKQFSYMTWAKNSKLNFSRINICICYNIAKIEEATSFLLKKTTRLCDIADCTYDLVSFNLMKELPHDCTETGNINTIWTAVAKFLYASHHSDETYLNSHAGEVVTATRTSTTSCTPEIHPWHRLKKHPQVAECLLNTSALQCQSKKTIDMLRLHHGQLRPWNLWHIPYLMLMLWSVCQTRSHNHRNQMQGTWDTSIMASQKSQLEHFSEGQMFTVSINSWFTYWLQFDTSPCMWITSSPFKNWVKLNAR